MRARGRRQGSTATYWCCSSSSVDKRSMLQDGAKISTLETLLSCTTLAHLLRPRTSIVKESQALVVEEPTLS
jgi:hypothetical protein